MTLLGSIKRAYLKKSVRSFEPDSASSFSNQLFIQHSAVNCTLVGRGTLEFLVRSCHICFLYLSDFGFVLLLFQNCDFYVVIQIFYELFFNKFSIAIFVLESWRGNKLCVSNRLSALYCNLVKRMVSTVLLTRLQASHYSSENPKI